jgi:LDH2 family malate/lactate/ureidoglycolate dehydrogenase
MFNLKLEDKTKVCRGYLFIVIDPSVFGELSVFKQNVSDLIKKIKSSRKAKGVKEIFIPGERSQRTKEENLKKGYLEVDDKIIKELKEL